MNNSIDKYNGVIDSKEGFDNYLKDNYYKMTIVEVDGVDKIGLYRMNDIWSFHNGNSQVVSLVDDGLLKHPEIYQMVNEWIPEYLEGKQLNLDLGVPVGSDREFNSYDYKGEFNTKDFLIANLNDPYMRVEVADFVNRITVNGVDREYEMNQVLVYHESDRERFKNGEKYFAAYVAPELLEDKEVALRLVQANPECLKVISPDLTHNKEFMLGAVEALKQEGYSIKTCILLEDAMKTNPLRNDKDFVLKAVEHDYHFIKDSALKDDLSIYAKTLALHDIEKGFFSDRLDKAAEKAQWDLQAEGKIDARYPDSQTDRLVLAKMVTDLQKQELGKVAEKPKVKSKGLEM